MAQSDDAVTACFTNTLAYHREAQRRTMSRSAFRMASYYLWAIWLSYFLGFLLLLEPRHLFSGTTIQTFIYLMLGLVFVFKTTPAVRIGRASPIPLLVDIPVTWRFTAERVAASVGELEHRDYAWQILHSVDMLPGGMLILPNPQASHWVPQSAFASPADYEQVHTWAKQNANTVRDFSASRGAEWVVSLLLVPFVLPLAPVACILTQSATLPEESFSIASAMYVSIFWRYLIAYWLVAAIGFFPLGRLTGGNRFGYYAGVGLILGLLWEAGSTVLGFGAARDIAGWLAAAIAWSFAGWAHWWLVVRTADAKPSSLSAQS